jgi:serine/threonine protein kinase
MALLGNGTYGDVYVNKEDSTKAIKVIKKGDASRYESKDHLIPFSINNEYIAKVFKVETDIDHVYIHMTRYDGDLQNLITNSGLTLPLDMVLKLENQIGSALEYLHKRERVLHADVKPDNILHDSDIDFYLCDFSLSMDLDRDTLSTTNQIYSAFYRPPILYYNMQIRDGNKIREEYDFYALFMTICYAYKHFTLVDDSFEDDEIVKCFWEFKQREFPRLLQTDFNTLSYLDMYRYTFEICY